MTPWDHFIQQAAIQPKKPTLSTKPLKPKPLTIKEKVLNDMVPGTRYTAKDVAKLCCLRVEHTSGALSDLRRDGHINGIKMVQPGRELGIYWVE